METKYEVNTMDVYNFHAACKIIGEKTKNNKIKMMPCTQMTDGSATMFTGDDDTVVASARLRFANKLHISEAGDMAIAAYITDIVFDQSSVTCNVPGIL